MTQPTAPLLSLLREPLPAIAYALGVHVRAARPGEHVLETDDSLFDPEAHATAGNAEISIRRDIDDQWAHRWAAHDDIERELCVAWIEVKWRQHRLEVVTLRYDTGFSPRHALAVVAKDRATAEAYFEEVCAHCAEVRDEVLVFANGCWNKSKELFASVRASSWEQLILGGSMAEQVRSDFDRFVAARAQYEQWGVPWKRGAIFIGPPGNGKTMCIKALIRHLGLPCLYVQTFKAPRIPEESCIRQVFQRARRTAPCVLVLEDIDSLVSPTSRSFFLNELDGFAANTGLITIASTNHPEQLDPAIVDRPSRFDRKYHFSLPLEPERFRYLSLWAARLPLELRLDDAALRALALETESFSFAYLKELFASTLMRFASDGATDLEALLREEASTLRTQMTTLEVVPALGANTLVDEGDPWELRAARRGRF